MKTSFVRTGLFRRLSVFALMVVCAATVSSCSKTCKCSAKLNGEVVLSESHDVGEGESCSDYSKKVSVGGTSVELTCSSELF